MSLTVVILTKNEERHITRALSSVSEIADHCYVVDSGSEDNTVPLAKKAGANVLFHPFVTHAQQFNWAIDQLPPNTEWVLRLDADEIVTPELAAQIQSAVTTTGPEIQGIYIGRRIHFLGRRIRWGGLFPISVLRLFRRNAGHCENRWMDEHILVEGKTLKLSGEIVDDNQNSLNWWIAKHNAYSNREVVDLLNLEFNFMQRSTVADFKGGHQAGIKRWIKERVYARLPVGFRAFIYFFYRFVVRLGFLDGRAGIAFHVLQGFWYRYLVDMKLYEVKSYMNRNNSDVLNAIREVLDIDIYP